ncbi:MAG: HAMP domain-containing sensor histidine kinase, partial [Oscillospiraceae bacterium]
AISGIIMPAEKKNISVEVHCDESICLYHDPKWTAEALFNILENAVKYSRENGAITIGVEQWEMYTKIDLMDRGLGIAETHINDIFKRFYREDKVRSIEGIGVGLYLTREIITMQQGYIRVKSKENSGSVFSVFLPNYKC